MQEKQVKLLHVLSAFYLRLGDAPRALALIALAAEAAPADPGVAETLIRCYIATNQADAALARLDRLDAGSAGRNPAIDGLRSRALWLAGRRDEARRLYARVLAGGRVVS